MQTPQDLITLRYTTLRDNISDRNSLLALLQYAREDGDFVEQAALCMLLAERS